MTDVAAVGGKAFPTGIGFDALRYGMKAETTREMDDRAYDGGA